MGATKQILVSLTSISIFQNLLPHRDKTTTTATKRKSTYCEGKSSLPTKYLPIFVYSAHFSTNKKNNWHNPNIIWIVMGMVTLSLFSRKYCSVFWFPAQLVTCSRTGKIGELVFIKNLRLGRLYNTYFPLLMRHTWVFVSFNSVLSFNCKKKKQKIILKKQALWPG